MDLTSGCFINMFSTIGDKTLARSLISWAIVVEP